MTCQPAPGKSPDTGMQALHLLHILALQPFSQLISESEIFSSGEPKKLVSLFSVVGLPVGLLAGN